MLIKKLSQNKRVNKTRNFIPARSLLKNQTKAQNEVGFGTMLMIILGLAALVLVIVGFTSGWGFLTKWFDTVKSDSTVVEQVCNAYITMGGNGYCSNSIDYGKKSYINCDYAKQLGAKFEEPEKAPKCDSETPKQICLGIKLDMGEDYTDAEAKKIKVNGESCGDYWKVNSGQTYEEVP